MRKDHQESTEPNQATLIVTYGNTSRRQRPLDRDVFLLGRSAGCDLALVSPEVAPVHCVLVRTVGGWRVRDCSGRLGTLVNGQNVHEGPLDDDDTLQVGSFTFRLSLPPGAQPSGPPAPMTLKEDEERLRAEADALAARQAELERQADGLRQVQVDIEERLHLVEEDEREVTKRRTALERDENELERLRTRVQREQTQRREELEAQARAVEEERRRLAALPPPPPTAPPAPSAPPPPPATAAPPVDLAALDQRRAELQCFARHLRREKERLADAVEQADELARLREEVARQWQEGPSRSDTVHDMPSPVQNAEKEQMAQEKAEAEAAAVLFEGEAALLNADLSETQARLREETTNAAALRKQLEIAASHEDELRRRLDGLERELRDRDSLIEKMQARQAANPWDTQALSAVEMEMNRFRMELDRDRREIQEELERLRQGQEDLVEVRREAELELSRERAQLARERAELNRLRDEVRRDQERLQRQAGSRARLASPRRFKEELTEKHRGGTTGS
jgi:DNA repair exonuclease SbcCD ATPase subunit